MQFTISRVRTSITILIGAAVVTTGALLMILTSAPAAAATTSYCQGDTTIPVTKQWDFSEPAGSTVFHETYHNQVADELKVVPGYPGVSANGTSVGFNDDGLLATDGNVFSPENKDFVVCVGFEVTDKNGYNLWQIGTSHVPPSTYGFLKLTGWYASVQTVDRRWKLNTNIVGTSLNGTGYHIVTMVRHGNVFTVYLDGKVYQSKTQNGIGPIHLNQRMILGGKLDKNGTPTEASDLLNGRVAQLKMGIAQ